MNSRNPQVYVGGITRDVSVSDIRKRFSDFGPIVSLSIKHKYAFVVSIRNFEWSLIRTCFYINRIIPYRNMKITALPSNLSMRCITRRPSAPTGSRLSKRTETAEVIGVAEIETVVTEETEKAETDPTAERENAENGETAGIQIAETAAETATEMVGEDHEAIRRQTSALSVAHLVIGKYYWQLYFKDNPNL